MNGRPNESDLQERPRTCSRLLQIEDNPEDVELFRIALAKLNISLDISVARNGEEALAFLQRKGVHSTASPPDLIILDLNLPKMDGREMLAALKRDHALKIIPVVVFTTSDSPLHVRECYTLGAACYLVKPIDFAELVDLLGNTFAFWMETQSPPH